MNGEVNNRMLYGVMILSIIMFLFLIPNKDEVVVEEQTALVPSVIAPSTTVLFVGDIMLDRYVRNRINQDGFDTVLGQAKVFFDSINANLIVGNLEGPFTSYPSKTTNYNNKELVFTFDPILAPKLKELGFDVLGLANNHTLNFGYEGLTSTKKYLDSAGIKYYGHPDNISDTSIAIDSNGVMIGLVGYHEFSYKNLDVVLDEITRLRPLVDFLVVTPHWGVEYEKEPRQYMVDMAHKFIDHGADAVIGAHPHVVQTIEYYNYKPIFYSLGNFIFDQFFSKEVKNGLAVLVSLKKGESPKFTQIPIETLPLDPTP
jgi:poly-gamma-glutamate synthesis protein (capsule biosynthesis protein)